MLDGPTGDAEIALLRRPRDAELTRFAARTFVRLWQTRVSNPAATAGKLFTKRRENTR